MSNVGRVDCPSCGVPAQQVLLPCGFCGAYVQPPSGEGTAYTANTEEDGEVIAYRGFKVEWGVDGVPILFSPVFPQPWKPGGPAGDGWYTAECRFHGSRGGGVGGHDPAHHSQNADIKMQPPVVGCGGHPQAHGCGFYLSRTWAHALENGYHGYSERDPAVLAKCQIAGKVIAAMNGWRAQHVKLLTIYVPHELWKLGAELKAVYGPHGVEVDTAATMMMPGKGKDGHVEWCERCSAKMPKRSNVCGFCQHIHR